MEKSRKGWLHGSQSKGTSKGTQTSKLILTQNMSALFHILSMGILVWIIWNFWKLLPHVKWDSELYCLYQNTPSHPSRSPYLAYIANTQGILLLPESLFVLLPLPGIFFPQCRIPTSYQCSSSILNATSSKEAFMALSAGNNLFFLLTSRAM